MRNTSRFMWHTSVFDCSMTRNSCHGHFFCLIRLRLLDEILAFHTGQDPEKIHRDTERDFVLTAEEAKEYGIIDDVITSRQTVDMSGPITRAS